METPQEVDDLVSALEELETLARDLGVLRDRASRERQGLIERREALRQRHEEFLEALSHADLHIDELVGERLERYLERLAGGEISLEESEALLDQLERELEEVEKGFSEHCQGEILGFDGTLTIMLELLQRAGVEVARPVLLPHGPELSILEVGSRVAERLAAREQLAARMAEHQEKLDNERAKQASTLEDLAGENLGPDDRREVARLLTSPAIYEDLGQSKIEAQIESFRSALTWIGEARNLSDRIRQDEIKVERQKEDLVDRWKDFQDEDLRRYHPELSDRVEALIHGLPSKPRSWKQAGQQLERASALFRNLERYTRTRAAEELEQQLDLLKRQGSALAPSLRDVIDTIERLDHVELPSSAMRSAIRNAARQIALETSP